MSSLKTKHITKGFDGNLWISMLRQKRKQAIASLLLPKAEEILPKISYQKFNYYLKKVTEVVGINKRLIHHISRKTFASIFLLYNYAAMEISKGVVKAFQYQNH